ncbi:MAG: Dam family site-specific DNA-(adenine-N6)-methyltransferase [Flavobacterium sp.]|nr:Dam family site-specific DNA-(adenine-N6)-methyltransferase [Flavobacterium sp.]
MQAKPFLKWAGGKSQLINDIKDALPKEFTSQKFTYVEPFVGSGAILFWILENFPNVERAVINDINADLTNTYKVIADNPEKLLAILEKFQKLYYTFENDAEGRKVYYMEQRSLFNSRSTNIETQAALFIFLNRTCFNGLFRVNKSNGFNVPMGSYINPTICDTENIMAVSKVLQRVEILTGDYKETLQHAEHPALFYFDPPYKPLSKTSSFNSYAKDEFGDNEQIQLRDFCKMLNEQGHYWLLSNSDVKGKDMTDTFFDDIYQEFNINRVWARRNINANADKRGKLTELLITNYDKKNYIPVLELNKTLFTNFDKPYWVFMEKFPIENIKFDTNKLSFHNDISEAAVETIATNFDLLGWIPITLDKEHILLDGQHRLAAAKKLGLKYIDVVIQDTELLTSEQHEKKTLKKRKSSILKEL